MPANSNCQHYSILIAFQLRAANFFLFSFFFYLFYFSSIKYAPISSYLGNYIYKHEFIVREPICISSIGLIGKQEWTKFICVYQDLSVYADTIGIPEGFSSFSRKIIKSNQLNCVHTSIISIRYKLLRYAAWHAVNAIRLWSHWCCRPNQFICSY